jgi:FtsH-binding integral membrane protein
MESTTVAPQPQLTREESGTLLGQTMGLVAVTAGLFALGAYLGRDLSYGWGWVFYATLGLVIFAGLTAFDFQRLRRTQDIRSAPLIAASIFLDVLNVFLLFLSIFGRND